MKNWNIETNEKQNSYLIANPKSIWIAKIDKESDIEEIIEQKQLKDHTSILFSDIKEIIFIDSDNTLHINFKEDDNDDIDLELESSVFKEMKAYFISNLRDVTIKNYSLFKQIQPSGFMTLLFGGITAILYNIAISIQNGETVRTSGRRGLIKKIFVFVADFLGPIGSLIVGGLITLFFLYILITTIRKPKEGKVIKIKDASEIKL